MLFIWTNERVQFLKDNYPYDDIIAKLNLKKSMKNRFYQFKKCLVHQQITSQYFGSNK